jgi:hypothetical protein
LQGESSAAGISTRDHRSQELWSTKEVRRKLDGIHQGRSPADINLIVARAAVRLAVRAAGSVGKRPTVMCVPKGMCNPGWPVRPGAFGGESCRMNLTA